MVQGQGRRKPQRHGPEVCESDDREKGPNRHGGGEEQDAGRGRSGPDLYRGRFGRQRYPHRRPEPRGGRRPRDLCDHPGHADGRRQLRDHLYLRGPDHQGSARPGA